MPKATEDRDRLTPQERAAIAAASSPSGTNAVLTRSAADALYEAVLTADQRAAITGADAPTALNPFATRGELGGGGLSIQSPADVDTGVITSGLTEDISWSGLPTRILIVALDVRPKGAGTAVQAKLYYGNPAMGGTDLGLVIGAGGSVDPNHATNSKGPQRYANTSLFAVPYLTSAGGRLWLRVTNNDAGDSDYTFRLRYLTLEA